MPTPPTVNSGVTLAAPATVTPDGGTPAQPAVGSVEIAGTAQTGYQLSAGPGITLGKVGPAIQISVDQSSGADIPVGDIIPGAANTVIVTDSSGSPAEWALLTNANISSSAAIAQSKIAITPTVTIPVLDINWASGNIFQQTLQPGLNTFTFSNTTDGQTIVVKLTSDGGGSTVGWPGSVKWAGGSAPVQSTPSKTDVYTFVDIGGTIYGSTVQNLS